MLLTAILVLQVAGSFAYPVARYGLAFIEPFTFAFYRYLLASTVLLALSRLGAKNRVPVERGDYWRILLLGVLIIPLNQTLYLLGQSMTGAGHGAFLFATTPIWVFLLAMLHLREPFRWRLAVGIALALGGVIVIMLSGDIEVRKKYLLGDCIMVVSVLAWAYYTVLGKPLVRKYGALRVTAYAIASGTVLYVPFGLFRALRFDYSAATTTAWLSVAYLALGISLVVYVLWYWVLKYMDATRLAVYHNVQPIIATTAAFLWLGEKPDLGFAVGGAIVLAGVLISETGRGTG